MALESVLRGEDTTKPDQWHPERLRALVDEVERHPRAPGRSEARLVLRRRGDVLPTGSAAETRGDLALRAAGVRLQRQARIRVYDGRGRLRHTYWVDFADVARRLALEIDGAHHRTAAGVRRDYRRDNVLGRAFEVCRYAADDVRRHPERFVLDVRRRLDATKPVAGPYRTDRGVLVRPNELGADVVDPTL
jgi:very-short-patch-repair endonuclease